MAEVFPRDLMVRFGARTLLRYGTPTHRRRPADRGGEEFKETFSRADAQPCATYVGRDGLLHIAAANKLRLHWVDTNADGVVDLPTFILESNAVTNLVENSDCEADIVGWNAAAGATVTRDNAHAMSRSWAAKIVVANANFSGAALVTRAGGRIAAAAATNYSFSYWVFATGTAVGKSIYAWVNWWNVTPAIISSSSQSYVLVAGWQRLTLRATSPAGTVTADPEIITNGAQGVFTIWADAPQFEASLVPSSPILTGTGALTRAAELTTLPLGFGGVPMTIYTKFVESGNHLLGVGQPRVYQIGQDNTNAPSIYLTNNGGYSARWNAATGLVVSLVATAPNLGDVVELCHTLDSTGTVQLTESVNGGAPVVGATGGPQPLSPALVAGALIYPGRSSWIALHDLVVVRGVRTLAEMQAIP